MTLLQINKNIFNAVEKEELDYWMARREQYYEEGLEAVNLTIEDDITDGIIEAYYGGIDNGIGTNSLL